MPIQPSTISLGQLGGVSNAIQDYAMNPAPRTIDIAARQAAIDSTYAQQRQAEFERQQQAAKEDRANAIRSVFKKPVTKPNGEIDIEGTYGQLAQYDPEIADKYRSGAYQGQLQQAHADYYNDYIKTKQDQVLNDQQENKLKFFGASANMIHSLLDNFIKDNNQNQSGQGPVQPNISTPTGLIHTKADYQALINSVDNVGIGPQANLPPYEEFEKDPVNTMQRVIEMRDGWQKNLDSLNKYQAGSKSGALAIQQNKQALVDAYMNARNPEEKALAWERYALMSKPGISTEGIIRGKEAAKQTKIGGIEGEQEMANILGEIEATKKSAKQAVPDKMERADRDELLSGKKQFRNIDAASKLLNDKFLAPYIGKGIKLAVLRQTNPEFAQFMSNLGLAMNEYRRLNFGTAQTASEIQNFLDVVNSELNVTPEAFKKQLDVVKGYMKDAYQDRIETLRGSYEIPTNLESIDTLSKSGEGSRMTPEAPAKVSKPVGASKRVYDEKTGGFVWQ